MSQLTDREKAFQDAFNSMLGNKIGRPLKPYKDYSPSDQVLTSLYKTINEGRKAKSEITSNSNKTTTKQTSNKVKLTDEQKSARQKSFLKDSGVTKEGNRGFFDKFKDVVGRGMDIVSRPGYTVSGALYEQAKAIAEGEPFWSTGDELLYGAARGASGKGKFGIGDVLREAKKGSGYKGKGFAGFLNKAEHLASLPVDPITAAAEVSKKLPKPVQKWFDRGIGLAGDIAYDPLTWATGGTEFISKTAGKEAASELLKTTGQTIAEKVAKKAGLSTKETKAAVKSVTDRVDKLNLDIAGGANKDKNLLGRESKKTLSEATGEATRNSLIDPARKHLENVVEANKKGLAPNERSLAGIRRTNQIFADMHDEYLQVVRDATIKGPVTDRVLDDALQTAVSKVSRDLAPMVETATKDAAELFKDEFRRAPVLKIGGKTVAKFDRIGEAASRLGDKIAASPLDEALKSLSYSRGNPGVALGFGRSTRSELTHEYKKLWHEVSKRGKNVSKEDAKIIQEALQDGTTLADPVLEGHRAWLRGKYDEIHALEESYGLRRNAPRPGNGRKGYLENYVYTDLKSNSKSTRELRDSMREHVKTARNYDGYTLKDLEAEGAKPETNAFNNLLARQMKANHDIAPIHFARLLNDSFAIKGTLSKAEIIKRKLIEIGPNSRELPEALRMSLKKGEKMYLTRDTHEILSRYRNFADTGSKEHAQLLHAIDYVTNKFKRSATLYYPSFHVRNFIGDMFMGALDGVGIRDYIKIFNKWDKRATSTIKIAGKDIPFHDLVEVYDRNLSSSGHLIQEIGKGRPTARISGSIGDWAQKREDFGRFAHFVHALDDEMKHQVSKFGDTKKAFDNAVNAAAYRVDKYKLDYSALTNLEQKYIKRAIPFYTYPRKAITTLAEAAVISPRIPANTARMIDNWQKYAEKNNPAFDPIGMPGWMRDSPVVPFGKGKNPLGFDVGALLPIQGATGWAQNPLAEVNPLIRAIPELSYGKNVFTHEKVRNPGDVLLQNIRPLSEFKRITKDSPAIVKISNLLGVPVRKISKGQQDAQVQALKYTAKGKIQKLDDRGMKQGYHVTYSERLNSDGQIVVRITDNKDGSYKEFATIDEAEQALKKLLN